MLTWLTYVCRCADLADVCLSLTDVEVDGGRSSPEAGSVVNKDTMVECYTLHMYVEHPVVPIGHYNMREHPIMKDKPSHTISVFNQHVCCVPTFS